MPCGIAGANDFGSLADKKHTGLILGGRIAGETLAFGDICYFKSDGKFWKSDATTDATMPGIAMALDAIAADVAGDFLLLGWVKDNSWSWNAGATLYLSATTPGAMTETAPSSTGNNVQIAGQAMSDTIVYFKPGLELVEIA